MLEEKGEVIYIMNGRKKALLLVIMLLTASITVLYPIQISSSESAEAYYPTAYTLLGATTYIGGALADLQLDNGTYMTFRSYETATSPQTLYAHQETTTIAGTPYYLQKLISADTAGTNLSVSTASIGRHLWGQFVYPLTGLTSIPASTWTIYYRTLHSSVSPDVSINSPSSVPAGTWTNSTNAYTSDDQYAYTVTNGATQEYGNYGFNITVGATITKVEVGFEAYTAGNEKIAITCSWDNGTTWATEFVSSPLGTTDPNTVTWVDFTAATNWTIGKLSDANFRTRVKNAKTGAPSNVYLDWIPVRVTYTTLLSAHADIDILIRKANGTIREIIATDVANSSELSETSQTLSGTYPWPAYTVIDQTDYLEIDYYCHVTTPKSNITAYLTIDDNTLDPADQTKTTNVMLPSEYTMEIEFTGSSNTQDWAQLVWTIDSAWTTDNVTVTLQLYNYTLGDYPTTGDGYIAYTSSATPNTDETKSQTITTNPTSFRDSGGNWKIRVKGVKSTTTPFDFKADLIKYETTALVHDVAILSVTPSPTTVYPGQTVNITVIVENQGETTETFNVTTYYNDTIIETQNVTNLASGANTTLLFIWNTTGVAEGNYTIKAEASVVPGETDTVDNVLISNATVTITAAVHDVAIISVTPSPTLVNPNRIVNITVIAENQATETETFNVTAYYNSVPIGTKTVTNLVASANTTLTFVWNTTGVAENTYTIKAVADTVPGETDTLDNTFIDDTVTVVKPTVAVSPANIIGPGINETFTINITISNVIDLYSWQAGMTFNPSVLQCLNFTEGPFLKEWAEANNQTTIWTSGTINNTAGIITYHSNSLTGPISGATGNGTLGTISFQVTGYGNSTLHLTDVILLDSTLTEIPSNTADGYFRLPQPPVASFTYSPLTPSTGETVTFNATASYDPDGTIISYSWDFGDGANATGVVVEHAYADNGTYTVTLTVIDNDGLNSTESKSITVLNRPPVALFTESATSVPTGTLIYFNASQSYDPDGTIVSYFWDFGDGTNATGVTVEHAYADDGPYTVTLTVTDNDGATANSTATKTISNRPPIASFTENATTVYTGIVIQFNASSSYDPDGSIVSYFWTFGDGTNTTGMIVTHAYSDNGTYIVTLTVTDDDGATANSTATKTILNRPPVASFTESATTVYTGETITFNASTSYDPDGSVVNYFWDFGDGTNASGVIVTHAYTDDGTYNVTLTVTDDDGATDNATSTKTVLNRSPVASFTESAEAVYTGEIIYFNASASYDPDGSIVSYFWTFGDGTNATGMTVEHSYAQEGTYTVILTVTDDDGASASTNSTKTVGNRPPVANFTESATTVYTGEFITFNASTSYDPDGNITSYFWTFGDGTNVTGVVVSHAYVDDGVYTVTLTVTDDDNATASANATKTILNRPPVANFTESAETVYTSETITFNASQSYDPDGSITSYFWDFGDGINATGVIVDHAYADDGTYTVTLIVTDDDGATANSTATKTILNRSPVASFTENATTVQTGVVIRFNASASYDPDGSIISYFWDFGDGTNATGLVVDHAYADDGVYTVNLTVTDDDNATASANATKTILNRSPVANFTESATTVYTGESITFNASTSYDSDGSIVNYFWTFGDGTNASGVIVTHAYANDGTYTVTLTVTDDDGASDNATSTKTVLNTPPVASFTESTEAAYTGEVIYFNASASYDPDGSIVSYFWDFGDGTNATGVTVEHAYTDNGTYTVTLTVTDNDGATASSSAIKIVGNRPPVANFTESATTVYTGESITFNASASYDPDGSITSYFWTFGDGTNATGVVVTHAYVDNGEYLVTLIVTDNDGATASSSSNKTVLNRPPVASFTESADTVLTGEVIYFNASTSYDPDGSIVSYFWDFGDGTNTTGMIVTHAYSDNGTYIVTLTVTDDDGATANSTATKTILNRPPVASFTESATTVYTGVIITFNASASYDPDGYIISYFWTFGDGTNSTGVIVNHAYSDNGTYTVTLTITDNDGATASSSAIKTVMNRAPVAIFTESTTTALTNEVIYFNASASYDPDGSIVSYFWTFGDGTNATGVVVSHAYVDDGVYTVTLTITDDDGATASTSATKTILNRSPVANFTESATTVYTGESISFNASQSYDPDGTITSYFWDFGDGTNATGMIVNHTYSDDGTYTVTLIVTDDDGATANSTATKTILNRSPVANFTESATTVYTGESITFNASTSYDSDGSIVNYFWTFGDGTNASGVIVTHAYANDGTYTVTLTVTDDDGASDNATSTKTVLNTPPVASFTESAEAVYTGEIIYFNASASYDPDGSIVIYFWDFGDGTNATGVTVEHAYTDNGTYTVTLTVTDNDGATASSSAIKIVGNRPPVANFTESATTVYTGESITFNASQSYDPDGTIISYFWTFGDGTNATGVVVSHAYVDDGVYTVTLTVTDDDNATASANATKTILNRPPVANFTESAETVYTSETITFNASTSYDLDGSIVSYFWTFGDGTNATGVTVEHAYTDNGTYTVTLIVTDDDGATASINATKTVLNRPPVASFTESVHTVLTGEVIYFNASASYDPDGSIVSYFWDFGDGTNATGVTVEHAYTLAGNYTVSLTVTDDDGATATATASKTVIYVAPDVAVLSVVPSATEAYPTWVVPINITVVVENQGTLAETFNVTVYHNETAIETKTVTLAAGANTTLIFSWNLTGVSPGNYTIRAEASILPGEVDTTDNTLTSDVTVRLKQPGDANDDGILNVYDTGILGKAWGSSVGEPYYDVRADFNGDGTIDDYDLQILQLYWP